MSMAEQESTPISPGQEFDLTDMALAAAHRTGFSPKACKDVLDAFAAILPEVLAEYGRADLHHIGVFRIEKRAPRSGITPDGQPWDTPERQEVVYHAAPAINTALTERTGVETYSA
jgi:nucleoid DNA-binding protein